MTALVKDVLYLDVKRGDNRFVFVLDVVVCPDNSARMCSGVPMPPNWNDQTETKVA